MRWSAGDRSNIDDERGRSGGRAIPIGIGGVLVLAVLSWATGTDFLSMLTDQGASSPTAGIESPVKTTPAEERMVDFVDAVAKDVQDTWARLLGSRYQRTRVDLFRDSIDSGCGLAQSATGPFYCPADSKVYLDLGFFRELAQRFGAPGEFAEAYVIAHEFGHHVQKLLGLQAGALQNSRSGPNSASVAIELQADCFAGIWGYAASESGRFQTGHVELDPGDAEQALRAAASIGDDRLQKMSTGHVAPERFTHGTSAQRVGAFTRGMMSGDPSVCDTSGRRTP